MFMKLLQTLIVLLCFCLKVEAQMMGSNHVMRGGQGGMEASLIQGISKRRLGMCMELE